MIFVNGFVHCDPHPGNVLVRKRPGTGKAEIVLLDHGLYQVGEAFPTRPAQGLWACLGSELTQLPDRPQTREADSRGRWERPCPAPRAIILCKSHHTSSLQPNEVGTAPFTGCCGEWTGCARGCAGAMSAVNTVLLREAQASPLGSKLPFNDLGLQGEGVTQPQGGGNVQWERGPEADGLDGPSLCLLELGTHLVRMSRELLPGSCEVHCQYRDPGPILSPGQRVLERFPQWSPAPPLRALISPRKILASFERLSDIGFISLR